MPEGRFEGELRREEERIRAACRRFQDAVFGVCVFNGTVWRPALKTVLEVPSDGVLDVLRMDGEHAEKGKQ